MRNARGRFLHTVPKMEHNHGKIYVLLCVLLREESDINETAKAKEDTFSNNGTSNRDE
jgi:hypothetical protein